VAFIFIFFRFPLSEFKVVLGGGGGGGGGGGKQGYMWSFFNQSQT
jgi:hypothetical protein